MKAFMDKDFLLTTETAKALFHDFAEGQPIIDYHNHLSAKNIYQKRRYRNLTQIWLEADHYKWRCMRVCGVDEHYITGDAHDYDKFMAFAKIVPCLIGSPVYHWVHMELQRYFDIYTPLTEKTAPEIWQKTCEMLQNDGFDPVELLKRVNVKLLCTTDDPVDDLRWHRKIRDYQELPFQVLPSFRPDRFLNIDQEIWYTAIDQLRERFDVVINDWESLQKALGLSLDFFCKAGCKVTDHGFTHFRYTVGDAAAVVDKAMQNLPLTDHDIAIYQSALLRFLAKEYSDRGLVMQLRLGCMRNNSPKLMEAFGADAGGDSIGAATDPFSLSAFLADMERINCLPKVILYNLNPSDSDMLTTMAANFGDRVQYGAAWWLLDHIRGINDQLDRLMETGMLSKSVGMVTDSRSYTSFVRHEYYRRILCEKIGILVENGQYPCHMEALGEMVKDICTKNAEEFFGFS